MEAQKMIHRNHLKKQMFYLPLLILVASFQNACGGNSSGSSSGTSSTTSTTASPTPYVSPSPAPGSPPINKSFTLEGSSNSSGTIPNPIYSNTVVFTGITADSRLIVDLVTGSESQQVYAQYETGKQSYEGAIITSGCLQIYVSVYDDGLVQAWVQAHPGATANSQYNTNTQIGSFAVISSNTTSSSGSGTCGSTTASTSYDFSNYVLASGSKNAKDIMVSQAETVILSNSATYYSPNENILEVLPSNYVQSGTLVIHTDTTQ